MRLGIDARLVHYSKAGIGQYILHLVSHMAEIDRTDDFAILQSRKQPAPLVCQSNFKSISVLTPSHHRLEQITLPLEIRRLRLDVLHSPDFIPPFRRNCRSVITIHDLAFLIYPNILTRESARYYGQIDGAVRNADHMISDSASTRDDVVRRLGVQPDRVTVIPLAADPVYRPIPAVEARRAVQERYHLTENYVLFVGTIEPRKNLPTLFEAYRLLLDRYRTDALLIVAGRVGWLSEGTFTQLDRLELRDRVRFIHDASSGDLLNLYNAAQALVLPSFYEGFGLPALEAMACGTPVIASNVSSLPEVVGDAGVLIDPRDPEELAVAILRVLSWPELREEMRAKGLARAACFSWQKTAQRTLEVYRQVAAV